MCRIRTIRCKCTFRDHHRISNTRRRITQLHRSQHHRFHRSEMYGLYMYFALLSHPLLFHFLWIPFIYANFLDIETGRLISTDGTSADARQSAVLAANISARSQPTASRSRWHRSLGHVLIIHPITVAQYADATEFLCTATTTDAKFSRSAAHVHGSATATDATDAQSTGPA